MPRIIFTNKVIISVRRISHNDVIKGILSSQLYGQKIFEVELLEYELNRDSVNDILRDKQNPVKLFIRSTSCLRVIR